MKENIHVFTPFFYPHNHTFFLLFFFIPFKQSNKDDNTRHLIRRHISHSVDKHQEAVAASKLKRTDNPFKANQLLIGLSHCLVFVPTPLHNNNSTQVLVKTEDVQRIVIQGDKVAPISQSTGHHKGTKNVAANWTGKSSIMETTRSKKQHSVQELRAGTVQRLSQQFLKATTSQPPKPVSPMRYQALAIPKQFVVATTNGHLTEPSTPSPTHIVAESYGGGHSRQLSAPQLFVRPTSPAISNPPSSSATFTQSWSLAGGLSCSSAGSDDSFVSALSHLDSPKEPSSPKTVPLWKQMLDAIEQEDRPGLDKILHAFDFALVLQTLVTWTLANKDNHYRHDPDVLLDAKELLGPAVDHLNMIQVACFLFNEELALDLLNFVATVCEELESKKILYEFMGKLWGDGNTTLHLASFLGMADLTKRLLDLGANVYKMNHHKYKPVDCADENTTRSLFLNLTEGKKTH